MLRYPGYRSFALKRIEEKGMIKGEHAELTKIANLNVCGECGAPLSVITEGASGTFALRCGNLHKPDTLKPLLGAPAAKAPAQKEPAFLKDVVPKEALLGNLLSMDEVVDKLVLVKSFELKESTFKEDSQYLSATIELDGQEYVLNTGAARVLQVFKVLSQDRLPVFVEFEKVQIAGGRRVYRIKN